MISFDSKKIGDKGTYELCSVSEDNRLLIWNGEKGNLLKEILLDELPGAIANSGSVLALGIGKSIIYRSKRFGDIIYNISEAHLDSITSLSFSQNGLELLSSGGKILRLWNVPNQY
jgi:WD40 repeat protein